jgi:hypothetical protein
LLHESAADNESANARHTPSRNISRKPDDARENGSGTLSGVMTHLTSKSPAGEEKAPTG